MKKIIIQVLLILVNLVVVYYIDYRIKLPDLNYFNGKDGGLIVRFEATVIMSVIYFVLVSNKLIYSLYGFIIGLFSIVICYLIFGKFTKLDDVFYQLTATILFILAFHFIDQRFNKNK